MATEKPITTLLRLASRVDWPRTLHMGGTLLRELRGDGDGEVAQDAQRAQSAGRRTLGIFEQLARAASGCTGSGSCDCAMCREKGTQGR